MKKILSLTIIAIIALFLIATNVQATETVVEVGTAEQLSQELSNVAANGAVTIKLTENINVTGFEVSKGENITIDLNGKKIAAETLFQVNNGTVILKGNGVIETTEDLFYVDTTTSSGKAKVEIGANVKAISGYSGIYIKGKNAEAHVYGSLTAIGPYDTIMGNGKITSAGTIINIYSGAEVISENSIGIYHPQDGKLNIYGGTITGKTAVYHKAGKLNISGGTLKATGEEAEYVHNSDGCDATGDALVIEACDYPGGFPEVLITGGTFISNNNQAIGYYKQTEDYKLENEKFITGGTFSSDVSDYLDEDLELVKDGENYVFPTELPKPTNLKWDGTTAKWDAVPNATGYTVMLYNGDQIVEVFSLKDTKLDLNKYITKKDGKYNFAVFAEGDEKVYLHSQVAASEVYVFPSEGGQGTAEQQPAEDKKDETPKTGAFDIALYVLGAIALVSVVGTVKAKKPGKYSK